MSIASAREAVKQWLRPTSRPEKGDYGAKSARLFFVVAFGQRAAGSPMSLPCARLRSPFSPLSPGDRGRANLASSSAMQQRI
jgi:hypothetical protein